MQRKEKYGLTHFFKTLPYQQTFRRRRGRFISPDNHFIIQQTHHKVYSVHNISKHTVGVGADLSRPYIIHNPTNTPQSLFIAQYIYQRTHRRRRGRFISPIQSSIITLEKVSKTTMNKSLQFDKYNSPPK